MEYHIEIPTHDHPYEVARWLWKNLVPKAGQSDYVQGELLRCIEKLCWEAQTNGNGNWDSGFEMIADYLETTLCGELAFSTQVRTSIVDDIGILRNFMYPYMDRDLYDRLITHVVAFCRLHPSPIPELPDPLLYR